MMIEESIRRRSEPSEGLPGSPIAWVNLGAVVYAWTDRRESAIDRAWWRSAGARFSAPWVTPQPAVQATEDREVVEELV